MRVSCIQLASSDRPQDEALGHALEQLQRARGSDLLILPELWPCGYFAFERYAAAAQPLDGPVVESLARKARELGAFIHTGSMVEREGDRLFNTSLLIDAAGQVLARYRKIHPFGYHSDERRLVEEGDEVVSAATPWGCAGLAICYDLRFPELFRRLVDQGAEVFLVASAWPAERLETWRLLCRTRALENQALLIATNAAGTSGGVALAGHSMIVDPWGRVLAEANDAETILTAEVDLETVRQARRDFPALADRRLR